MAECRPFPGTVDDALMNDVGALLGQALGLYVPGVPTSAFNLLRSIAQDNNTLVNIYCGAAWPGNCMGLCPNSDLAGPGVRAAFYAQSFLNAFLIAISPEDALSACWSAVLLTAAVILPAIIQKQSRQLTLHHAMLVLSFATMSTVAALASAPFCEVWREDTTPAAANPDNGTQESRGSEDPPGRDNDSPRTVPRVAVSLQWTWAVFLFTSPEYAQEPCNAGTKVVLFGVPFDVTWLNKRPAHYALFPGWLLTCMGITLAYGIALVYHNQVKFPLVPSASSYSDDRESAYYVVRRLFNTLGWLKRAWRVDRRDARRIMAANIVAFMLWAAFVAVAEIQRASNCVFEENSDWSFGQVSSMLLAAVPLWPIAVAISRERARSDARRKRRARRLTVHLPISSLPPTPGTPTTSPPTFLPGSPPPARSRANSPGSPGDPMASPTSQHTLYNGLQLTTGAANNWPSGARLGDLPVVVTPPQDDPCTERPFHGWPSPI